MADDWGQNMNIDDFKNLLNFINNEYMLNNAYSTLCQDMIIKIEGHIKWLEYTESDTCRERFNKFLSEHNAWNRVSTLPPKGGKYLLYAPKFIYEGCEYSETLDVGLYHEGLGFSMPSCFPEPKVTHWLEIRKPDEVGL